MAVDDLMLLFGGLVAVAAAGRLTYLVVASRSDETAPVRHALVAHGVAILFLAAVVLIGDPLGVPALAAALLGLMVVAWGVAAVLIGLTYGLGYDTEGPAVTRRWGRASGRAARSPEAPERRPVESARARR